MSLNLNKDELYLLEESGIGVFDDALAAELLDSAVALDGDETVLDVELPQSAAVVGDGANAFIGDQFAAFHAQLFQIGTVFGEEAKSAIGDVALA